MQNNVKNDRPRAQWVKVFTETHQESGITVTVSRLDLREPRYSIGFTHARPAKDGKGAPFFAPFLPLDIQQVEPGRFAFTYDLLAVLTELTNKAKEWAMNNRVSNFDTFIEQRLERENRFADRFKKDTRVTGKTAKKKAKLKKGGVQAVA